MAGKNTSVTLSEHYLAFAESKVREGRFGSTSEVIRAGLRLLEAEEQKLEALRAARSKERKAALPNLSTLMNSLRR